MNRESTNKLSFQIEVKRVLEILSNDIYDSPYALLRENIQNAYDAILMRREAVGASSFEPKIEISLDDEAITITDNGIGMNKDVISNNFWKAGSSGKNTEVARRAGVIGTFGIGAMANFGVCESMAVTSHYYEGDETIETYAERESLSVSEECIDIDVRVEKREPGTTIIAKLDSAQSLNLQGAKSYLMPYIQYVPVPILINGELVSQKEYKNIIKRTADSVEATETIIIDKPEIYFSLDLAVAKNGHCNIYIQNIKHKGLEIKGEIILSQGLGSIYGLRNYFGLANIPVASTFNFGGVVNLSNLHPTAGREALSQESINNVAHIINIIEEEVAVFISTKDVADINSLFLDQKFNLKRNFIYPLQSTSFGVR